ncbi:MAG: bleomycin resistance protein [Leptolyngbyaceae cyanobacterium SM1_1_3]|nr:bleomycin resistance protein [Leptolyngbyaceae cyanobacterium SM1_1_3]NJN01801.1 bleomycin resistance protein [Leptolyngbyaceae cyanobacterium RM1_1_2]NJO11339.1 bleomycin resistance protein [Leptolyngbyaceae cyanobacterium SL_1_1]
MNIKTAYTRLLVQDLEACFHFYRDTMGFEVVMDERRDGYAEFAVANMRLALFRREEMAGIIHTTEMPADAKSQDRVVLIFTVSDLDEICEKLKHEGTVFASEPMKNANFDLKIAYIRDPDGNLIGLFENLA